MSAIGGLARQACGGAGRAQRARSLASTCRPSDDAAGTVSATTTDSNVWGPGSGWEYRLTPSGTGTRIEVTLTRHGKGVQGKLIVGLLPVIGKYFVKKALSGPLRAR